ncbi:MAG: MarR family transcriptional regulator [Leptospiraceae bacterium]|nr:MarR family transcriptional regulator [Leptospiraceae bacterium]
MGRPTKKKASGYTLKYVVRISEWIEDWIRQELSHRGYPELVLSHCEILTYLRRKGACSQQELARAIRRDKSTVSTLVARLQLQGLIRIRKNPEDGRSRLADLSAEGRILARQVALGYARLERRLHSILSEKQRTDFLQITQLVYTEIERDRNSDKG